MLKARSTCCVVLRSHCIQSSILLLKKEFYLLWYTLNTFFKYIYSVSVNAYPLHNLPELCNKILLNLKATRWIVGCQINQTLQQLFLHRISNGFMVPDVR